MPQDRPVILVVDDRPEIRTYLRELLEPEGYLVLEAGHGKEALAVLDRRSVDVVISDLQMPVLGGMELLELLRSERPELPVIILTGFGELPVCIKAFARGAFYFLEKPAHNEELLTVIRKALAGEKLQAPDGSAPTGAAVMMRR